MLTVLALAVPDRPDVDAARAEARALVGLEEERASLRLAVHVPRIVMLTDEVPITEPVEVAVEPRPRSKAIPALGLGASVGVGLVGALFTVRALDALYRAPTMRSVMLDSGRSVTIPDPDGLERQGEEVLTNGLVAMLCVSGAVAGLVTSTLLLLSD
ncbi:hypothetical protein L6R52_13620 [Myxococcota bacterium]|nr:hypothetical protein [Myxococcota bacterium]